ncbi:MAG: beta-N-acetylglucosaminidase domain-containing protein [Polyangiales bacterium]
MRTLSVLVRAVGSISLVVALACDAGAPAPFEPRWAGVIEGFYGEPYTHEARLQVIDFLAARGLDTYVYGPKDDPYHRDRWREPYPTDAASELQALVAHGTTRGVRVVLALAPGSDYAADEADEAALRAKLDQLLDMGAQSVCVLFDDVSPGSPAAEPEVQVRALRLAYDHVRARDRDATVCFIGPYYFGTAEQLASGDTPPFAFSYEHPSDAYYDAYRALPRDMPILWTGRHVIPTTITAEEARAMRRFVGRPLLVWDNVPVNDMVLTGDVFLGPWQRPGELLGATDGVLLNLMTQPRASLVMVGAAAHAMLEGSAPEAAWTTGAADVDAFLSSGDALQRLAPYYRSHPLLPDTRDAVQLAQRMETFWTDPSAANEAALREELLAAEAIAADVATLSDATLITELAPAAASVQRAAEVARAALDAVLDARSGGSPDRAAIDAQRAELRTLRPQPGGHAPVPSLVQRFISDGSSVRVDVFGAFVERALEEL